MQHCMDGDGPALPGSTYGSVSGSPARSPPDSQDAGHMLASTPESQKRRSRRRMEDGGTPNPLYELGFNSSADAAGSPIPPRLDLSDLTPRSDVADDVPLDQGALTGGDKPSRAALERHTAELEAELLHMHTQCGQLKARLDASQALNNELQRALVDAHAPPQEQRIRYRGLASPALPAIAEHEGDGTAPVPPSPTSPFPTADVALHLANTTNQVLELQSRLEDRDAQLAAVTAQLQAAGLQPDAVAAPPLGARASLADISNVGSTLQHASPSRRSKQADDAGMQLAAERGGRQRLSACLSALAADLQARDERLSRMLASFASAEGAQPQQEGYRQSTAAMAPATAAQLDSGLAALGAASAGVLRELRQQAALAAALQTRCEAAEGGSSCEAAEQSAASDAAARGSTGTGAGQQPASEGDSNAVATDGAGVKAEAEAEAGSTAAAPSIAPETGRSRQGQGGMAVEADRMGAVRRLSKQFSEQVTALKLEFAALEQKLRERDACIAALHADAKTAGSAAKKAARVHEARIAALQRQLEAAAAGQQADALQDATEPCGAGATTKQLVELQAALRAVQHARDEDRRKHTQAISVLRERVAAAEAHAAELQRQLDAAGSGAGGGSGVNPSKASARIALLEAERNRKDLALVREQLAKKTAKLETAAREAMGLQRALAAREQVLIALREELAAAHRAHSEAAHKLHVQRQKAAPWR